jgi:hypothetical protein
MLTYHVDERVERLWAEPARRTVYGALAPLFKGEGGIGEPHVEEIAPNLGLVPGNLLLSGAEQELSFAWASSLDRQLRAFRVTAAFATVAHLYSLQGLRNLGPTLNYWRQGWSDRVQRAPDRADMELPAAALDMSAW